MRDSVRHHIKNGLLIRLPHARHCPPDEDSQRVMSGLAAGVSGRDSEMLPTVTNSSWHMLKWMTDYAELMR